MRKFLIILLTIFSFALLSNCIPPDNSKPKSKSHKKSGNNNINFITDDESDDDQNNQIQDKQWTWISGSDTRNQTGTYGIKGTPDPSNIPGSRNSSISWIDSAGNLWLFGGYYYSGGPEYYYNDLWKFDGTNWTWISGSDTRNQAGTYGTRGTPDPLNIPGARIESISWIDSTGNLWLFGGNGYDSLGNHGDLNDLWKFDGTNWTWISGSDTRNHTGTYGTKKTPDPLNIPGARQYSISWIDSADNLWLFGGNGYDNTGNYGNLNDLWKFDGTNWTWVSGSDTRNQAGTYGTRRTPDPLNIPGSRQSSISWIDSAGNLWLFGGYYYSGGPEYYYNDLWKFDGTNWTWVSGSNTANQAGTYGIKGTPDLSNIPGARESSISWIDQSGNLWLFGGYGCDSTINISLLNDLWKFDGTDWTWVSGSNTAGQAGTYGTKGTPDLSNIPGSRQQSISWIDSAGNLWLFGGHGSDNAGDKGKLNDLWKYKP